MERDRSLDECRRHYQGGAPSRSVQTELDRSDSSVASFTRFDQLHVGGRRATQELCRLGELRASDHVLDSGCALGGTSRYLASDIGCSVTGIDCVEEYIAISIDLARRAALDTMISFLVADAACLPFQDQSFDVVLSQHTSMNIVEKKRYFAECHRVLSGGGRLLLHELVSDEPDRVLYPTPWATNRETSHITTLDSLKKSLSRAGFTDLDGIRNVSERAREWWQKKAPVAEPQKKEKSGAVILFGEKGDQISRSMFKNITGGAVQVIMASLVKR